MPVTYSRIVRESDWDEDAGVEGYIFIRAATTIFIPVDEGGTLVTQRITSPGLYRIEDDGTTPEYLGEVFEEERATLLEMLDALGAKPQ